MRSALIAKATTGRVVLTEDDKVGLFEPLTRYGFLPTNHLRHFDPRYYTKFYARLNRYFHETEKWKAADRPIIRNVDALRRTRCAQAKYTRGPAIYRDLNIDDDVKNIVEATIIGPHFNDHDIAVSCSVAEIELSCRKAGLRFISHIEILSGASPEALKATRPLHIPVKEIAWVFKGKREVITDTYVDPDALFGIEYPEGIRFFALEYDRGNETLIPNTLHRSSWLRKLLCYQAISKSKLNSWLGIPKLHVLALAPSLETSTNILAKSANLVHPQGTDTIAATHIKPMGAYSHIAPPDDYLFTAEWHRIGHPPLKLDHIGEIHGHRQAEDTNRAA